MFGRKSNLPVADMKKKLDHLKKSPSDASVLNDCITCFLNDFMAVDDSHFAKLPMKKQMSFFVVFLMQKVHQQMCQSSLNMEYLFCLDKASVFMPDGADDRNAAGKNRPRYAFVVKTP